MGTVFITGASGFFGKALIQTLCQTNADHHYVCLYNSNRPAIEDYRLTWKKADLLDISLHGKLMAEFRPTYCVHLAWHFPPQKFWHAEENLDWLQASIHLFKAFCKSGGKVFMAAGSITEYDWFSGVLDEMCTPLNPQSLYSVSKKSLYELLKVIRDFHYEDTVILWPRIAYFFGINEPPQKLISHIIGNLKAGRPLDLISRDTKRPYAHVNYLGEILAYVLFNQREDIVFNLSASQSYSVGQIVDFIAPLYGRNPDQISYNLYKGPVTEPLSLDVNTTILREIMKKEIPDTFFEDLKKMALNPFIKQK